MINKKKLIEELINNIDGCTRKDLIDIIQNFPEEPEIDFDALYKELLKDCGDSCEKEESCKACTFDFLKSKHLSAPKPKQSPAKKVWTLKKEYEDFVFACGIPNVTIKYRCSEPEHKEFYDYTEEPDYSQVKVGDVVEIHHPFSNKPNYGIVQKNSNNMLSITCNIHSINAFCISYSQIKSLTILKAAE